MSGINQYAKGEPKKYYGTSGGWSNYPYHSNPASIVYLESNDNGATYTGKGYDANINNGSVTKQGGGSLSGPGHIYCAPDDPNLQAKPLVNGYDQRFTEIIDIAYFEQYFNSANWPNGDGPQNNKIRSEVKEGAALNASKKYTPSSTGMKATSLSGSDTTKKVVMKTNGNPAQDLYTCQIVVGCNQGDAQNINPKPQGANGIFLVTNLPNLLVRMNAVGDSYSGVYITSGNLWIEKNDGLTVGESLLQYSVKHNGNLKDFIDTVGKQSYMNVGMGSGDSIKYSIINNLFNGGIQVFYKTTTQQGTSSVMADENNSKINLIDFENYEKN